jgi:hypothetical protein
MKEKKKFKWPTYETYLRWYYRRHPKKIINETTKEYED